MDAFSLICSYHTMGYTDVAQKKNVNNYQLSISSFMYVIIHLL